MARGGYRPGSGRPKGVKNRPKSAKTGRNRKNHEIAQDIKADAAAEGLSPLDYMLKVMRDESVDSARRDRMAVAAAPFVHARADGGKGKKQEREEKAKRAGAGIFAPAAPPRLVANGGKVVDE